MVDLGPDQVICPGDTVLLDAGNPGAVYLWDNAGTAQTRTVDTAGIYHVSVTDMYGCSGADTVAISMEGLPEVTGINAVYTDTATYTFNATGAQFVTTYTWDFGDGSPLENGPLVQHRYLANGSYTVDLAVEGVCTGIVRHYTVTVEVVDAGSGTGIRDRDAFRNVSLYPNPARAMITVKLDGGLKMNAVAVFNMLGQRVADHNVNGATVYHLPVSGLAAGIYTLQLTTDKGVVTRKFEVRP